MGQAYATVERFYELFADGKITDATALFDPACITVMPGGALTQPEHEGMAHAFKAALPDARMVPDRVVETGEDVVVIGRFAGTHTGDLQSANGSIPASGNTLDMRFMDYFRVTDGTIVDHQTIFDQVDMLAQLGAMP